MKRLQYVLRVLRHSPASTAIKILSLGLGMAMCVFLLDMFLYITGYDKSYRDSENLYQVWMQYTYNSSGEVREPQQQCYGPIAGILLDKFPDEVESAASTSYFSAQCVYDGREYGLWTNIVADSLFFDTMGIEVLAGNPRQDLMSQDVVYLTKSIADYIFNSEDPIGKTIKIEGMDMTVRGVFADVEENSSVHPGAVTSFPTLWNRRWGYYGLDGGDSYREYVRLKPGTDYKELNRKIQKYIREAIPPTSTTLDVLVKPIADTNRGYKNTKTLLAITVVLGLSLLFVASLNYVLISIASLSKRAKAIGVQKCSGASNASIAGTFLLETAVILILSSLLSAVVLYYTQKYITTVGGINVPWILTRYKWSALAVVGSLFVIGGILPARLFARIPVTQVFRRFTERNSGWKRVLLFVQFGGIAFVGALLCAVSVQYRFVLGKDLGYDVEQVCVGYVNGEAGNNPVVDYIKHLPYVEDVAGSWSDPTSGYSGEFIRDDNRNVLFSSRFESGTSNYIDVMGMELLKGRAPQADDEAFINEEFLKLMHWNADSVFAPGYELTTYLNSERVRIVGLVKNFVIGDYMVEPMPYIFTLNKEISPHNLTIRLKEPYGENMKKLSSDLTEAFSGTKCGFYMLSEIAAHRYESVRFFRTVIMITSIIIVLIVLMGLIGFVRDEIQRRSKEIAIRKVNGAEASDIIRLLGIDVMKVAVPAVVVGIIAAWYIGRFWFEQFYAVVDYLPAYYAAAGLAILILILGCVTLLSRDTALDNPVNSIKSE